MTKRTRTILFLICVILFLLITPSVIFYSLGYRFDFEGAWLHIRSSNTEPVMRIITEAKDKTAAQKYIDAVLKIRRNILDTGKDEN